MENRQDREEVAAAFNQIYDETSQKVLVYITARCSSTDQIGDLFQETYMELYRVLSRRGPGYIQRREGFVFRLARQKLWRYYTLRDRLRRLLPLGGAADRYGGEPLNSDELLEGLPDQFQLEEESVDRLLARQVLDALRSRPTEVQKIFYLHFCMDLTLAQIARELGLSESGVKNKLYRTLAALRREYGLCSAEPPDGERTAG